MNRERVSLPASRSRPGALAAPLAPRRCRRAPAPFDPARPSLNPVTAPQILGTLAASALDRTPASGWIKNTEAPQGEGQSDAGGGNSRELTWSHGARREHHCQTVFPFVRLCKSSQRPSEKGDPLEARVPTMSRLSRGRACCRRAD